MQIDGDDAEARDALGAHGAPEHLVVRLAVGVQLGHAGIEEAEVQDRHPQPDGDAQRRPWHGEQQRDDDGGRAHDHGGHDRAPEHLGQCVAPEVREPLEHVHAAPSTGTCGSA